MTRKDYQLIADAFGFAIGLEKATTENDESKWERVTGIWTAIHSLENKLQKENERFNQEIFREAIETKAKETQKFIEESMKQDEEMSWGI